MKPENQKPFVIAIVGRPNVGKSSLFNALVGYRRAIVMDLPGTTRDEVTEKAKWLPQGALLCDSQGIFGEEDDAALDSVIARGDIFLFVVDMLVGITPFDRWLAGRLKQAKKPVCLLVNKTEDKEEAALGDFSELGFEDAIAVSAAHRRNIGDVKEWCLRLVPGGRAPSPDDVEPLSVALIGRPNTGKSTLMNRLAGVRISQVSPEPLTTRDPVAHEIPTSKGVIRLIDTAGMRRPRSSKEQLEIYSIQATTRMIREADVVFVCFATHEPVSDQDIRLLNLVEREGKPTVVLLNFWDRLTSEQRQKFLADSEFGGLLRKYQRLAVSGLTGWQTDRIFPMAWRLAAQAKKRVRTSRLNKFVQVLVAKNPPPARGRQNFNILYASQVRVEPPTFVFFMNRKANLPLSYQKYVENALRDNLGFRGQTIRVFFRGNERD